MADKAKILRAGLGIDDINHGKKRPGFVPGILDRSKAAAMEMGAKIARSLERQLGRLTDPDLGEGRTREAGCGGKWLFYCNSLHAAVALSLGRGKKVLVVTQPYISDSHVEQQNQMASMLRKSFGRAPGFHYMSLGKTIDLKTGRWPSTGCTSAPRATGSSPGGWSRR
jgi:hypothetical protein